MFLGSYYEVVYFGDRPVAVYEHAPGKSPTLTYYTTDHLGTPALVTDSTGKTLREGGFEPFGADYGGAWTKAEAFLRFPGQWQDPTWDSDGLDSGLYYNVFRWYQRGSGRYSRPDPLRQDPRNQPQPQFFGYAMQRPLSFVDPLGLIISHIEPVLIPYLDCGLQSNDVEKYWKHFSGSPEIWEFRSLTPDNQPLMGREARRRLRASGARGERSVTEPPSGRRPGRFWIELDTPLQCQAILYNVLHEMAHAYSRLVEGKDNATAHYDNTTWVQKEADRICGCCDAAF